MATWTCQGERLDSHGWNELASEPFEVEFRMVDL